MTIKNKKYWSILSYLLIYSTTFSVNPKIIQNGVDKNGSGTIILEHDFTASEKKAEENQEHIDMLEMEGKIILSGPVDPFLNIYSGENALARTGVIFDFNTEEDDKNPSILQSKNIEMKNGTLQVIGNFWSYPNGNREASIEDSKISLVKNKIYYLYLSAFDAKMQEWYYNFMEDGIKKRVEDMRKESYQLGKRSNTAAAIQNAKLHLKNSEIKIDDIESNTPSLIISNYFSLNPDIQDKKFSPTKTGLKITRTGEKLAEGKYDLSLNGKISIESKFSDSFGINYYDKESVINWYNKRYDKDKGTPLFLLGKNAKLKAKTFEVDLLTELEGNRLLYPELKDITYNAKEDRMIVFEKDSEVELETFAFNRANVKFEGGKVKLKSDYEPDHFTKGITFFSGYSQIMGKAIFNIEGRSILRGVTNNNNSWFPDKNSIFTNLEVLPESKIDVSYIKDAARDGYFQIDAGVSNIKDTTLKGGEYKFTFNNNTKIYLGYSKRALEQEIEKATSDEKEKMLKGIGLTHTSDADMYFKTGSTLYLYREKYANSTLKKNTEVKHSNDGKGNLLEFTGRLTFDNSKIHVRSNVKDELSDQLIATQYPILGEGAVLHLENKGEAAYTGKERIVLIKANKGTSSKIKFGLHNGKVTLGGFDYKLYERITENGKEYYLAHGVVEGVLPEKVSPKKFTSEITNTDGFVAVNPIFEGETVKDKKIKAETKQDEYAITYKGDSEFENSQLAALGGKGILSSNAKLNLKNSTLMSNRGLALDGVGGKELLTADENSSLLLENSDGGSALSIKNAKAKLNNVKKAILRGSYAIYSNGGNISGNGVFDIDGNIYHKGNGGVNLTLEKGSVLNSPIIDIAGNTDSSKFHFKSGSRMFVNNYSNANMLFDQGSEIHFYTRNQESENLDILHHGNKVIFTEPIHFENTDLYFRTNIDKEESDQLEILGDLTGTSANLHLKNHAESEMPSGGKEVKLIYAKTPENFKWNLANQVEVGGYFYNAVVEQTSQGPDKDIISVRIGDAGTRKATLSSTAKGMISNTVSDYTMHHSLHDSIFDSLYSNDYSSERLHSIWAKTSGNSFETKDYGMKNEVNTILVGMDRALNKEEGLHGGIFAGNLHNMKKIATSSGKGSFQGFTSGAYLSYRGYLGFGDAFVAYTTGKSKYNVLDTASDRVTNDRESKYLGAGIRFGKQFFIDSAEHFYVEPSAKITYGRLNEESSKASNGLNTKVDAIKSWTTGAYAKLGYKNQFSFGKLNSYAKAGVTQEILGKYNVRLNQNGVEQIKLDGNTMNYGVGVEYNLGNNSVSLDFDVKNSPVLKNYYRVSLGYQYKF